MLVVSYVWRQKKNILSNSLAWFVMKSSWCIIWSKLTVSKNASVVQTVWINRSLHSLTEVLLTHSSAYVVRTSSKKTSFKTTSVKKHMKDFKDIDLHEKWTTTIIWYGVQTNNVKRKWKDLRLVKSKLLVNIAVKKLASSATRSGMRVNLVRTVKNQNYQCS